jgi:hypothetical protein
MDQNFSKRVVLIDNLVIGLDSHKSRFTLSCHPDPGLPGEGSVFY